VVKAVATDQPLPGNHVAHLHEIYIAATAGGAMQQVERAIAIAGLGLEGDRYATRQGSFSRWQDSGRALSIISGEAIAAIFEDTRLDLSRGLHRRNLVISGLDLTLLKGRQFRIGSALFRGSRLARILHRFFFLAL
jgi:MOSC domain-containing protein YiiM